MNDKDRNIIDFMWRVEQHERLSWYGGYAGDWVEVGDNHIVYILRGSDDRQDDCSIQIFTIEECLEYCRNGIWGCLEWDGKAPTIPEDCPDSPVPTEVMLAWLRSESAQAWMEEYLEAVCYTTA